MRIRRLTIQDMPEFARLRSIAFLRSPENDPVAEDIGAAARLAEISWGCFTDECILMACLTNNYYQVRFEGHAVKMGGIGGVATLPEYRRSGAVRAIFTAMLRDARDSGEMFSTLYPFAHAFYRQFGYELSYSAGVYVLPTEALGKFRFKGWSKLIQPGESAAVLTTLYENFAARYNLAATDRDDRATRRLFKGDPCLDQTFTYLLGDAEHAYAYAHFHIEPIDGRPTVNVRDYAFTTPAGLHGLLGFLHRFAANCQSVRICLPDDIPMASLVDNPDEVIKTTKNRLMARVNDVAGALALMRRPEGTSFTIAVADDFLPENSGVYRVTDTGAVRTETEADLEMDIRTFTQLCLGYLDLYAALFKPDVRLHGNEKTLAQFFTRKQLYLADHF